MRFRGRLIGGGGGGVHDDRKGKTAGDDLNYYFFFFILRPRATAAVVFRHDACPPGRPYRSTTARVSRNITDIITLHIFFF